MICFLLRSEYVFAQEMKEYAADGLGAISVLFTDNQSTIGMILGLRALLDEESEFPKGQNNMGEHYRRVVELCSVRTSGSQRLNVCSSSSFPSKFCSER